MVMWLLLTLILRGGLGLEVKDVPYGVALRPQGHAWIFTTAVELIVVMKYPEATMSRPLQHLQEYSRSYMINYGMQEMIYSGLWRVARNSRRGICNILRDGLHWLAGLATSVADRVSYIGGGGYVARYSTQLPP